MGIIRNAVTKAAADIVKEMALNGAQKGFEIAENVSAGIEKVVDATLGDKDTRHYRKEQYYLSKSPDSIYLIIQKTNVKKDIFCIYDPEENIRYYVQGKLSSKNIRISLLDSGKIPIASVTKK